MLLHGPKTSIASIRLVARTLAAPLVSGALACNIVLAQGTLVQTSNTADGTMPASLAPGSPAGSYVLSDFETINHFNGQLNITLPLLHVGGRGEAGYTMTLAVTRPPWTLDVLTYQGPNTPPDYISGYGASSVVNGSWWLPDRPRYGAGILTKKHWASRLGTCTPLSTPVTTFTQAYTHLVFVGPDGTEHTLFSAENPTHDFLDPCDAIAANLSRGHTFKSYDGSGLTFESRDRQNQPMDVLDILDPAYYEAGVTSDPSLYGELLFPNGLRYRIEGGSVQSITDRNGNRVSFQPLSIDTPNGPVNSIQAEMVTDALGRQIHISYDLNGQNGTTYDEITYSGAAGATRTIRIVHTPLANALRSDFSASTVLFPEIDDHTVSNSGLSDVTTEVILPNGKSYHFEYTPWGEVARIVLPTGGAIEYDHGAGVVPDPSKGAFQSGQLLSALPDWCDGCFTSPDDFWHPAIYRRLVERREYPAGGSGSVGWSRMTVYPRFEEAGTPSFFQGRVSGLSISSTPYVRVWTVGDGLTAPVETHHYFYDERGVPQSDMSFSPGRNLTTRRPQVGEGNDAFGGVEYRTVTPNLSSVRKVFRLAGLDAVARPCEEYSTVTAGETSITSKKYFGYDTFGNQTDLYEYDFASGSEPAILKDAAGLDMCADTAPTGFVRHTYTPYVLDPSYVNPPHPDQYDLSVLPLQSPSAPAGVYLRHLPAEVQIFVEGVSNPVSKTKYFYDDQSDTGTGCPQPGSLTDTPGILTSAPIEVQGVGIVGYTPGHDPGYGTAYFRRGNLACTARWLNSPTETWLRTRNEFDVAGNVRRTWDAKDNQTQFSYSEEFSGQSKPYAFANETTNAAGFTATTGHDFWTGKPISITAITGSITTAGYDDALDRLTSVDEAGLRQSSYDYNGDPAPPMLDATAGGVHTRTLYDGFGRETAKILYGNGGEIASQTDTKYDALGRVWKVSNPHTGTATDWTTTTYDAVGRVVAVDRPDGSVAATSYSYVDGASRRAKTTATDEAGKSRDMYYDALGRLQSVVEDPGGEGHLKYETIYTYDVLGNLTDVAQGEQPRHFAYDSLGRLLSALNPESGTTSYAYDANGNLVRKVAAGGVATCFWPSGSGSCSAAAFHDDGYDALNRPIVKQYSDGTPTVKWCYDGKTYSNGACNGGELDAEKGLLTAVGNYASIEGATSTVSSTEYRHQALGLVRWSSQTVGGVTYAFEDPATHGDGYVYAQGRLTGMYYPSGRQLTFGYDAAGRPQSAIGTKDLSSTQYVTNISYAPQVEIDSLYYSRQVTTMAGGALVETALSNRRGQAFSIDAAHGGVSVWNLKNFYCSSEGVDCASNNGNVISQRLTAPKTSGGDLSPVTVYGYDGINRLGSATESGEGTGWSQTFTYDRYGNQAITQTPLEVAPLSLHCSSYSAGNNRCAGTGFEYDNNAAGGGPGNITAFPGGVTASYDGENRQVILTDDGTWQYFYDGEGRRVKKVGGARTVVYVYDAMGQLAAEYDSVPPETAPCTTCYLTADHLGSTRLITDASGDVKRRYDYLPFGWDIQSGYGNRSTVAGYVLSDKTDPKFTGKERDYETTLGLDYFGARYFSGAQGRFITPDWSETPEPIPYANLEDPQSLNLYSYVRNNPLSRIDLDGHIDCTGENAQKIGCQLIAEWNAEHGLSDGGKAGETDGPKFEAMPLSTGLGQTQDRAAGAAKTLANNFLEIAGFLGAPQQNLDQIRNFLHLDPASQNQEFGGKAFEIAAIFAGGGKTGRKVNEKAFEAAKEAEDWIRRVLKRVEALPNKTPELGAVRDRLKRALADARERMLKSEPHGVRGQGPR